MHFRVIFARETASQRPRCVVDGMPNDPTTPAAVHESKTKGAV
jgi:hypothetical protein